MIAQPLHNGVMAKKKTDGADRHKKGQSHIRLGIKNTKLLRALVEHEGTSMSEEVNRAVREMLKREGYWDEQVSPGE